MSSADKNNANYSASDIEKYLKGELSAPQMHELERAALEDPFLADALEGMALHSPLPPAAQDNGSAAQRPALAQDLDELRTRLQTRVTGKNSRRIPLLSPRMRVAATIILLLGLGGTAWYTLFTGNRSPVAFARKEKAAAVNSALREPAAVPANPGQPAAVPTTPQQPAAENPAPGQPAAEQPAVADKAAWQSSTAANTPATKQSSPSPATASLARSAAAGRLRHLSLDSNGAGALTMTEKKEDIASAYSAPGTRSESAPIAPAPSLQATRIMQSEPLRYNNGITFNSDTTLNKSLGNAFYSQSKTAPGQQLVFSGKVLDVNNNPLSGASLFLKGYTSGTVTDQQGQFSLRLRPQDSARQLMISLVGYEQASLALNDLDIDNPASNIIRLQQQHNSLDEVVITGYGAKRKETRATAPSASTDQLDSLWQKATPAIGRTAYLEYLATSQKTLKLDSTITGTETVSFEVDRNGILTAFKIEQSLSPAHDAGLIHLVIEGPAWKLLKGKRARAVVSMIF
jgi:CarboxypepD_reg-like domain